MDRPEEFGGDYRFAHVRLSVRKIPLERCISFSDFWYQVSFLWFLKTDGAGFFKKEKCLAKNGETKMKNTRFRAFLGNLTLNLFDY